MPKKPGQPPNPKSKKPGPPNPTKKSIQVRKEKAKHVNKVRKTANQSRQTRGNNKPIKGSNCACNKEPEDGSCFSINELRVIAKHIRLSGGNIEGKSKALLYSQILEDLSCNGDRCLSVNAKLPEDIRKKLQEELVPMAPKEWVTNPTAWLSNFDIEAKCAELVRPFPRAKFLGVFPMDAEHKRGSGCISQRLCDFHPAEANKTHDVFAAVFNTDYNHMPGSHWVALVGFINDKDPRFGLYYYDSLGQKPSNDINTFITRISEEMKTYQPKKQQGDKEITPYVYNNIPRQLSNTECGMFCISFIDSMLNSNRTFKDICTKIVTDEEMIRKRTEYFELPVDD